MKFNKPTIEVLGEAARVIQNGSKLGPTPSDAPQPGQGIVQPAYDLDE